MRTYPCVVLPGSYAHRRSMHTPSCTLTRVSYVLPRSHAHSTQGAQLHALAPMHTPLCKHTDAQAPMHVHPRTHASYVLLESHASILLTLMRCCWRCSCSETRAASLNCAGRAVALAAIPPPGAAVEAAVAEEDAADEEVTEEAAPIDTSRACLLSSYRDCAQTERGCCARCAAARSMPLGTPTCQFVIRCCTEFSSVKIGYTGETDTGRVLQTACDLGPRQQGYQPSMVGG